VARTETWWRLGVTAGRVEAGDTVVVDTVGCTGACETEGAGVKAGTVLDGVDAACGAGSGLIVRL
jgi:hypothetical protein